MLKKGLMLVMLVVMSASLWGCVSLGRFEQKEQEAQALEKSQQDLRNQYAKLSSENEELKSSLAKLDTEKAALLTEKDKITADNKELDKVLNAKTDTFSRNIAELRQKITDLTAENSSLKEEIARLQKLKEEEVQKTSKTYEDLLDKMKNEISQGQVTISELKGKLTVNMVDAVLFDSGKSEVKPDGLLVLQKVIDILKNVRDKAIRIEGHTDNVKIGGELARKFPTNWELSAARAINVLRYLQQQGIDPLNLSAIAFGEFKPVASNDTKEGKAQNRRIEIVLVAKE